MVTGNSICGDYCILKWRRESVNILYKDLLAHFSVIMIMIMIISWKAYVMQLVIKIPE